MKARLKFFSVMLMVLSLSLSTVSCSSDDDEQENNPTEQVNNSIVGVWKLKGVVAGEVETNDPANNEKIKPEIVSVAIGDYETLTMTLKSDGTCIEEDEDEPQPSTFTYTFSNGLLTFLYKGGDTYEVKASVENGILTIEYDYLNYFNRMELDKLIELGISDPVNFHVTKAIAKTSFSRQQ
jgi:hypothetical protein